MTTPAPAAESHPVRSSLKLPQYLAAAFFLAAMPASALVVSANFTAQTTTPVTSAGYTATGNTVNISLGFAPTTGTNLTIVRNTGISFIQGTFDNLAHGQRIALSYGGVDYPFVADYFGGTGNDLVLVWGNSRLLAWGGNLKGQLGTNNTTQRNVPTPVTMTGILADKTVTAISAGNIHSLALCSDNTLAAWGSNGSGELGINSQIDSFVPVAVSRTGVLANKTVVAISAGEAHSLALCSDGSVAAWGYNGYGELGDGSNTSRRVPVLVNTAGVLAGKTVVAIAAGEYSSIVLCSDGTLATWGRNNVGQLGNGNLVNSNVPVQVNQSGVLSGKTVIAIATGTRHRLVLCSDGTLATWGNNNFGHLGNNSLVNSSVPVLVNRSGVLSSRTVTSIACGGQHSMALCSDGNIATWGSNMNGQLGQNANGDSQVPVLVYRSGALNGKTPTRIASGGMHSLALASDATLVSWGFNFSGQLGNNSTNNSLAPVLVNKSVFRTGERFNSLVTGTSHGGHSFAIVASPPAPTASTASAMSISPTGATLKGSVNAAGTSTTVTFEYGQTTSYGTVVSALPATVTGTATTAVGAAISGLTPGATYHFRVVAASANGTTRGSDMSFIASNPPTYSGYSVSTPFQTATTILLGKLLARVVDPDGGAISITSAGPTSAQGGTVALNASTILYTPPAAFTGTDSFTVVFSDSGGATTIGSVTVNVGPSPTGGGMTANPPKITSLAGGRIELKFHGIPGRTYQIQRSTDMNTWTLLSTASANQRGALTFIDEAPPQPNAFYRLALP